MSDITKAGTSQDDWITLDVMLGLGKHLLPVAPVGSPTTPNSKLKSENLGKIPSALTADGRAYGIANWTKMETTPEQLDAWSRDPRLSVGIRCGEIVAIDSDIEDPTTAAIVRGIVEKHCAALGVIPAIRTRSNSNKSLYAFRVVDGGEHA